MHKRLGNNCDVVVFTPEQFQLSRDRLPRGWAAHSCRRRRDPLRHQRQGRPGHETDGDDRQEQESGAAVRELRTALGQREEAVRASKAFAELIAMKAQVEYGAKLISLEKAESLVRRAHVLVDLAIAVVRLGR